MVFVVVIFHWQIARRYEWILILRQSKISFLESDSFYESVFFNFQPLVLWYFAWNYPFNSGDNTDFGVGKRTFNLSSGSFEALNFYYFWTFSCVPSFFSENRNYEILFFTDDQPFMLLDSCVEINLFDNNFWLWHEDK